MRKLRDSGRVSTQVFREGAVLRPFSRLIRLSETGIRGAESLSVVNVDCVISQRKCHVHPHCAEFIFCLRGENLKCLRGDRSDVLRPGEVFVAFPDEPHCVVNGPKGRQTYALLLRVDEREGLLDLSRSEADAVLDRIRNSPHRVVAVRPAFAGHFREVLKLIGTSTVLSVDARIRVRHRLTSVLLDLDEACRAGLRAVRYKDAVVDELAAAMRREPLADYSLESLCIRLSVSKTGLIARFKRVTGMTPHAFLLRCRIERAKELLKKPGELGAIAERLRFSSLSHFSRAFSLVVGQSPSRWRSH